MSTAVSFPGNDSRGAALWLHAPIRHRLERYQTWRCISHAMQLALRERLLAAYSCWPGAGLKQNETYALLVYCASECSPGRSVTDLSYDLLNSAMMNSLFRKAGRKLPGVIERFRSAIPAARQPVVARFAKSQAILAQVRSSRNLLERILAAEGALVDSLMQFAEAITDDRQPYFAARERLRQTWMFRLSKIYPGVSIPEVEAELFAVATSALETVIGGPAHSSVTARAAL